MAKTLIIAEAGVNHNGSMETALRMVEAAAKVGADYIKFQTWKSRNIISRFAPKALYQRKTAQDNETMLEMEEKLEFPYSYFIHLKDYCKTCGIGFMSSPFDCESAKFLCSIGVDHIKIPSGEITNLPLLETISELSCPLILSTGMSEIVEIENALQILQRGEKKDIILLHCNSQYPTPMQDVNLLAMKTLQEHFKLPVGLSDHTDGIEASLAAIALGAVVIEKHFTLSRSLDGPDHRASLEPDTLSSMIHAIRNIEMAMGNGIKKVTDSERENRLVARKSLVAARRILKGEPFSHENLAVKRPGTGISPMLWHQVLGQKAKRNFAEDELIEL